MLSLSLHSRKKAALVIGDKGDIAVRDHLAQALDKCRASNLTVTFLFCNLSPDSIQLLANALQGNTTLIGFTCGQNPSNFPNDKEYDPQSDLAMKQAVINTRAPIKLWNGQFLHEEICKARRILEGTEDITRALVGLHVELSDAQECVSTLASEGYDTLEKLHTLKDEDLQEMGIHKTFHRRTILQLKHPSIRALPDLPKQYKFYGFASHNWGTEESNHNRVKRLVEAFNDKGKPLWFDDERLTGHVSGQITSGIDDSATFIVFITAAYVEKVCLGAGNARMDWCYAEFNYASGQKRNRMIAVVMEKDMQDQTKWKGQVGLNLINTLWVDYTSDDKFEWCCSELARLIAEKI